MIEISHKLFNIIKETQRGILISIYALGVIRPMLKCVFPSHFRAYVNGAGSSFPLHSDIVMPYIAEYGTPEQIEKFIPDMAAGKKIGAIAMTEPAAGRWVG